MSVCMGGLNFLQKLRYSQVIPDYLTTGKGLSTPKYQKTMPHPSKVPSSTKKVCRIPQKYPQVPKNHVTSLKNIKTLCRIPQKYPQVPKYPLKNIPKYPKYQNTT